MATQYESSPTSDGSEVQSIVDRLKSTSHVNLVYEGDPFDARSCAGDPGPISISRRMDVVETGTGMATFGPTATHRQSFEIALKAFAKLRAELDELMGVDLPALEAKLDAAGVPWTPGRAVPDVKTPLP